MGHFPGGYFLMFVIVLYLGPILGDFWSSVMFLPYFGLAYLAIWLIRKYVVTPRVGIVKFGHARKTRLAKFTVVMVAINASALILGILAVISFGKVPGQIYPIILGMILLIGFSLAAFFLDYNHLYIYGLLVGFSPIVGEWLWNQGYASHHGLPITFGITGSIMILVGLVVFIQFLGDNPVPIEDNPAERA